MGEANAKAFERLCSAEAVLMEVKEAREICPELESKTLLHAGPPIEWDRMCGPMRGAAESAIVFEG